MQEETILYETKSWIVYLSQDQSYLGRSVIVLKRECKELSKLTQEEWADFYTIVQKLENAFKKAFNATMFNWTCLMNDAYKDKEPKPQVHWHFRPRYRKEVQFAGHNFEDLDFAHHYSRERKMIVPRDLLDKISKEVSKYL